ncbi:MAG: hypothetical protein V4712_17625 [Pseudomonadota bacterium]
MMRRAVESAAFAVALRAKTGGLTALDVDHLRTQAEQLLPDDAPLRRAITGFATQFEAVRHNPPAWVALGDSLARAVELALIPDAVDSDRRDIHG